MLLKKVIYSFYATFTLVTANAQRETVPLPVSKNGFVVIAHRGSHLVKPENTLAAIEEAINLGADYVEVDLRTTSDGHLVLCHNETVDATTNGSGLVGNLTWKEISNLRIRSRDGKEYHIPAFSQVLKLCKNRINIYLDFKEADVIETYRQIRTAGMEKQVVVYLNKESQYASWRKSAPRIPLMSSLPESIRTREKLQALMEKMSLQVLDNVTDTSRLRLAREAGIHVWLDVQGTDERPAKWKAAIEKGVQGVQTDYPKQLIEYLHQRKLRNGMKVLPVN